MHIQKLKDFLRRKPVKITLIVLGSLLLLLAILLTAASIYVQKNKAAIIAKIKTEFSKRANGELHIGDVDFSVWKDFPYITVGVQNVSVTDSLYHKPMFKAGRVYCAVNLFKLLSADPAISRVRISDAQLHLFVDSTGFNNAYLLTHKKQPGQSASPAGQQPVTIKHIDIERMQFVSEDAVKRKRYEVTLNTAEADISSHDSLLNINLREDGRIGGLGFNIDRGAYLEKTNVKGRWKLQFNKTAKILMIRESGASINNADFKISGNFNFNPASSHFSLHAVSGNLLYKEAKALLMQRTQEKIAFIDVTTPMAVDASIEGRLVNGGDPVVRVTFVAKKTILTTPVVTFSSCNFSGFYYNNVNPLAPPSDPNSVVYFQRFTGNWYSVPMQADSIRIDNLKDPSLSFNFKSQCALQQLDDALDFRNISFDSGAAKLNLQYAGPLTSGPEMLANINGAFHIEGGHITYVPHNLQFINCNGDIRFSNNSIDIQKITCDYKKNHFTVTGSGNQINRVAQNNAGKSDIALNVSCPDLNLQDFEKVFSKPQSRNNPHRKAKNNNSPVTGIDNMLDKEDLVLSINAKRLSLGHFTAQNAKAALLLQQTQWFIQKASLDFGEGSFVIDAAMHRNGDNFETTGNFAINNADVRKAFYSFDNFGQDGISYANLRGTLNVDAQLGMILNNQGSIIPRTLQGKVNFTIRNGELMNFEPVMGIQKYVLKNRDLSDIQFAEIKNNLIVKEDKVIIPRMEIASTAMRIFVEGVYGVASAPTDISIQVPLSNLSKKGELVPSNKGANAKVGISVYLRAKSRADGKVKIGLDLFHKFRKSGIDTTGTQ
ncbi:MAG TPA: AsmA family protein [Chitinophagaceae bacterium]|nr:AsmA family protein [Chitinophagaceae bacterium]